jgi:hypothetical protein
VEVAGQELAGRLLEIRRATFSAQAPAAYSAREVETLLNDVDPGELCAMADDRGSSSPGWPVVPAGRASGSGPSTSIPRSCGKGSPAGCCGGCRATAGTGAGEIRAGVALHALPFCLTRAYTLVRYARAWDGTRR